MKQQSETPQQEEQEEEEEKEQKTAGSNCSAEVCSSCYFAWNVLKDFCDMHTCILECLFVFVLTIEFSFS